MKVENASFSGWTLCLKKIFRYFKIFNCYLYFFLNQDSIFFLYFHLTSMLMNFIKIPNDLFVMIH